MTTSQSEHAFEVLQTLGVPLLLADEDGWAFADFDPGRPVPVRRFPDGTTIDPESAHRWRDVLYSDPPPAAMPGDATEPVVSFDVRNLRILAATADGEPAAPAIAVLDSALSHDLLVQITTAVQRAPRADRGATPAVIEQLARTASSTPDEVARAHRTFIRPGDVRSTDTPSRSQS